MERASFEAMDGFIWHNGEMVEWCEARLHVLSHSLHYGGAVFEGIRSYRGRMFKAHEHFERFLRSAELMQYRIPHSIQVLEAATYAALEANGLNGDAYIRPVAWRGADFIGIGSPNPQINVSIAAFAWNKPHTPEKRENGVRLAISEWRRAPAGVFPPQAKSSANYAIGTMSWNSAVARGYDDAMLLDTDGNIAESTGANMFFVRDGALHTPTADCFLAGITRETVLKIAESLGIRTVIGKVTVAEALGADEVFLCGTAYEVLPVAAIEDSCYASGPVTKRIRAAYQGVVDA